MRLEIVCADTFRNPSQRVGNQKVESDSTCGITVRTVVRGNYRQTAILL